MGRHTSGLGKEHQLSKFLLLTLFAVASSFAQATVRDCLNVTGYALDVPRSAGVNSKFNAISQTQGVQVAPGSMNTVLCSPISGEREQAGVDGDFATLDYAVGTGVVVGSGAIAPGLELDAFSPIAKFQGTLFLPFRLTTPAGSPQLVDIAFRTLYQYGPVTIQAQNRGTSSNGFSISHSVFRYLGSGNSINTEDSWPSGALNTPGLCNKETESTHVVQNLSTDADASTNPYVFRTDILIQSRAKSIAGVVFPGEPLSSALASLIGTMTFAVETPEGVEVEFDYEELLGLNAPALGIAVPALVPLPPALLLFSSALIGLFYRRSIQT